MENKHRFIRALLRQSVDATPIWIMRQAGRYLPEYRAVRAQAGSFLTLCKTPELASEVTLQPLRRFDLDAAIIFSDILTIPDAMGLGLEFVEGEGPHFTHPICTEREIENLAIPDVGSQLRYVADAVSLTHKKLQNEKPLIGFAGSPWTLACYMIEGGASKDFSRIRKWSYTKPKSLHCLLDKLAKTIIDYLNMQIAAGANAVMLFDTWGGILSTPAYQEFSLGYLKQICAGLTRTHDHQTIPRILFTKNGGQWLELMLDAHADALGLDWTCDLNQARQRVGTTVALQGNLDPAILLSTPEVIAKHATQLLADFGSHPGHIFNLGHGITPDVPPEHVAILVDTVHEQSRRYHDQT